MTASNPQEKTKTQIAGDHRAWADSQPVLTACYLCNVEPVVMAAGEAREWAREHRERHHPELTGRKRRRPSAAAQRAMAIERSEWRRERRALDQ